MMIVMGAVTEIEPKNVDTGLKQGPNTFKG